VRLEVLDTWLDAYPAAASSCDADDIAKVIEQRPRPSYDERKAVLNATGRPEPSRDPFPILSKGGGRLAEEYPLAGAKRTSTEGAPMSANNPKRT
jgi:hypothetical protein